MGWRPNVRSDLLARVRNGPYDGVPQPGEQQPVIARLRLGRGCSAPVVLIGDQNADHESDAGCDADEA